MYFGAMDGFLTILLVIGVAEARLAGPMSRFSTRICRLPSSRPVSVLEVV